MESTKKMLAQQLNQPEFKKRYQAIIEKTLNDPDIKQFIACHQELMTDDVQAKSYAKFNEYMKERDARKQGLPVASPGMEPVLVMNQGFVDVVYQPTAAFLAQKKQQAVKNRIKVMSMPKNIREASFAQADQTMERTPVMQRLLDFVEEYSLNPNKFHRALYLVGSFGVGKTYLLGATANELAQRGFATTLVHVPTLSTEIKQSIGDGTLADRLEVLKKADILMLDDIGAESNSPWFRDEILGVVLQYRMLQELPTFFSSNFSIDELKEHLKISNKGDDEELKAKRLLERIYFLATEIQVEGINRRHQHH